MGVFYNVYTRLGSIHCASTLQTLMKMYNHVQASMMMFPTLNNGRMQIKPTFHVAKHVS